jgi:uncharacterized membrane protein
MPKHAFVLSGILLLGFAVRAVDLDGQSLHIDEISEIKLAHQPAASILHAADSMPPLFAIVHKAWLAWWDTDAAARWLSVLLGVAAIGCVCGIGRELAAGTRHTVLPTAGSAIGLAAAFLLAILPLHVDYSRFVRAYALFFLLVALALWLLLRAVHRDRRRDWCGFALVSIVGAYTHYYFIVFLAVGLLVIVLDRGQLWIGRRALATYAAIGLCGLPLAWLLPGDFQFQTSLREPNRLDAASFGYTYFSFFSGESLGPSTRELQTMSVREAASAAAPWAIAIAAVVALLGFEGWRALRGRPALPILLALLLLPVLLVGGLGYVGGINYHVRFVLWVMIPLVVWLGAGLAAGWSKWHVRTGVAIFVCVSAIAIYNRHAVSRYQIEDLRGAAAYLQTHGTAGDTVYIVSDYLADGVRYYLDDAGTVVELPRPGKVNQVVRVPGEVAAVAQALDAQRESGQPFWLVYSRPFHGDPGALVLELLTEDYGLTLDVELAGVTVYHGGR